VRLRIVQTIVTEGSETSALEKSLTKFAKIDKSWETLKTNHNSPAGLNRPVRYQTGRFHHKSAGQFGLLTGSGSPVFKTLPQLSQHSLL